MNKTCKDYKTIWELLREFKDKDLDDTIINERLKDVDKTSLFHALYFTELERDYAEKQYYKLKRK